MSLIRNLVCLIVLLLAIAVIGFGALNIRAEGNRHDHAEESHDHDAHVDEKKHEGSYDDAHDSHEGHGEERVQLSPEVLKEFDIRIETANSGLIEHSVSLPGEVRPDQDHLSHIAPRFPGIVKEVHKNIGDSVKAGDHLAIVESNETLALFPLVTQTDGVIIAKHITRGEPVSPDRDIAFTVAGLDHVWVDVSVYSKEMHLVRVGQHAEISAGHGLPTVKGEISYISPVVDEETRTSTARVVIPNSDGIWRPGMFVTVSIEIAHQEVSVVVPLTSIEMANNKPVIFVQEEGGFERREVELGVQGGGLVEVLEGLSAGERYVAKGGFTIKSELAREELSGGHNH